MRPRPCCSLALCSPADLRPSYAGTADELWVSVVRVMRHDHAGAPLDLCITKGARGYVLYRPSTRVNTGNTKHKDNKERQEARAAPLPQM